MNNNLLKMTKYSNNPIDLNNSKIIINNNNKIKTGQMVELVIFTKDKEYKKIDLRGKYINIYMNKYTRLTYYNYILLTPAVMLV